MDASLCSCGLNTNTNLYNVVVSSSSYGSVTNTPEQVVVNPANVSFKLCPDVVILGTVEFIYTIRGSTDLSNPNAWITETNLTLTRPIEYWDDASVDVHSCHSRSLLLPALPIVKLVHNLASIVASHPQPVPGRIIFSRFGSHNVN